MNSTCEHCKFYRQQHCLRYPVRPEWYVTSRYEREQVQRDYEITHTQYPRTEASTSSCGEFVPKISGVDRFTWGILFRWGSLWIGAHWGGHHKRLCVNLIPCITFWFVWPGGDLP